MAAILWSVLNLVVLVVFGYACVRVFKVLRREIGTALALLFLLGLFAFRNSSNPEFHSKAKNLLAREAGSNGIGNAAWQRNVELNANNKLSILVEGRKTGTTIEPLGLYTTVSGLMLGHKWTPLSGSAYPQSNKLAYNILLLHEWSLLGVRLYVSSEEYEGILSAADAR